MLLAGAAACGGKHEPTLPGGAAPGANPPAPIIDVSKSAPASACPEQPADKMPDPGSPPLVRCVEYQFHPVNQSMIDYATYGYYTKVRGSIGSGGGDRWVPYSEDALQADWTALWKTNFLDNLWIQVVDEPYANGVMGKHIVYHFEERPKLKGVEYVGSKVVEVSKIEDELRKKGLELRVDSFIDETAVQRVKNVVKQMYAEEGYQDAQVTPTMTSVQGVTKLVILQYEISQGPQIKIKEVQFDGAKAFASKKLAGQMKENTAGSFWSFITGSGKYQEAKLGEDVQKVVNFYFENGYTQARIGLQQLDVLGDSKDGKSRYVRLRMPVDEGVRFRMGTVKIEGTKAAKPEILQKEFTLKPGDWVN